MSRNLQMPAEADSAGLHRGARRPARMLSPVTLGRVAVEGPRARFVALVAAPAVPHIAAAAGVGHDVHHRLMVVEHPFEDQPRAAVALAGGMGATPIPPSWASRPTQRLQRAKPGAVMALS